MQAIVHASGVRFTHDRHEHIVAKRVNAMPVCPSCNRKTSEAHAHFCAHCGFALPDGSARSRASSLTPAAGATPPAFDALGSRPWRTLASPPQANPRAVAVGLAGLLAAVLTSAWLSFGPGSTSSDQATRRAAEAGSPETTSAARTRTNEKPRGGPKPPVQLNRYRAEGYSFAYPKGWSIAQANRPVTSYRETVVRRADGGATVTIDYSPGEATEPAVKASEVRAPTSITPGYRQISFRPTSVRGHPAFVWTFEVADADPRRVDLFLRTRSGGFAILAHGSDLEAAAIAARLVAGSLSAG
jgi:hypothetical protein